MRNSCEKKKQERELPSDKDHCCHPPTPVALKLRYWRDIPWEFANGVDSVPSETKCAEIKASIKEGKRPIDLVLRVSGALINSD